MAKQYFKENNIEYKEYDVSTDKERAQEMIEKTHQYGVPVIVINGKVVVGFDREKVSQFLGM
jgi:glutaredoxin